MKPEKREETAEVEFSKMVTGRLGGETMTHCYQCGTCASSCPVAKKTPTFNPREVIKLGLLGEKKEVLAGDAIWLCCSCYNCQERCPQKVEIAELIYALRNMAFTEEYKPSVYSDFASAFINDGRIVGISQFAEKKRSVYGLPPLQPTGVDALKKILSAIGFGRSLSKGDEEE